MAVGRTGTPEMIFTSKDGKRWTPQKAERPGHLRAVIYANGRFIAAGGDLMVTSKDGLTWSTVDA